MRRRSASRCEESWRGSGDTGCGGSASSTRPTGPLALSASWPWDPDGASTRISPHPAGAGPARILNERKTERAQAEVDGRRAVTALADAIAGEVFDQQKAAEGATIRVRGAERLRDTLVQSLARIHAVLKPEQRARLAYLIRTGTLSL